MGEQLVTMQAISNRKKFPLLGAFGVLMGVVFIGLGVGRVGDGGSVMFWLRIFLGFFLVASWTSRILNDVVQIVVNDEEIRYRRRKAGDVVISWRDVLDSEIGRTSINFRYKGPHDIQSQSIPLRHFQEDEAQELWEMFSQKKQAQAVTRQPA